MENNRISEGKSGVQSVERSLDIIEALATEPAGIGLSRLADMTGLHKSTVHRLLATLLERGYVSKQQDGSYRLGLKMIEAASCFLNGLELQTEARPYISRITRELGLTAHLGILEGDKVVYIEKMDVIANIKMYNQIGLRVPAYCSSLGKCLLSGYSRDELELIMSDCTFERFTQNTITSMEEFHKEMKKVRTKGWAIDNEESELNHRCIGAPIFDYRGDIIASISASGNNVAVPEDKIAQIAEYIKDIAMQISREMGYINVEI